jgi:hypothetical protein
LWLPFRFPYSFLIFFVNATALPVSFFLLHTAIQSFMDGHHVMSSSGYGSPGPASGAFTIIRIRASSPSSSILRKLVPPSSAYQYKLRSFSIKHSYVALE